MSILENIRAQGLVVPDLIPSKALFSPYSLNNGILVVSGQLPFKDGKLVAAGSVPAEASVESAREAARACVVNILSSVKTATDGDFERVESLIRLGGFVVTSAGFHDAPSIINAASELMVAVFGERGRHARVAIGVSSLPFNASVEVEATFSIRAA
jgi:enamine deaminase RidA (YjgF/YER057c/UK114 family)